MTEGDVPGIHGEDGHRDVEVRYDVLEADSADLTDTQLVRTTLRNVNQQVVSRVMRMLALVGQCKETVAVIGLTFSSHRAPSKDVWPTNVASAATTAAAA